MSDDEPIPIPAAVGVRPPDAYEASYMGADEQVVHRDKMSWHPAFHLVMLIAVVAGVAGAALSGAPVWIPLLMTLLGLAVFSSIMTLRTTVSTDNVHIQYGVVGPTIPLEEIELCEPTKYSFLTYGGWGIRYSIWDRSWCYNMIGDGGRAVRIHYRTKRGGLRKVLVASEEPALLADAINRARAGQVDESDGEVVFSEEVELKFGDAEVSAEVEVVQTQNE